MIILRAVIPTIIAVEPPGYVTMEYPLSPSGAIILSSMGVFGNGVTREL